PDLYSTGDWRGLANDFDRVVSAMVHYNKDLTWCIFEKAKKSRLSDDSKTPYEQAHERMSKRLNMLRKTTLGDDAYCPSRWNFGSFEP
ncbi:hypothetical protein KEM54_005697, partial [Ascosphaera aggregata]